MELGLRLVPAEREVGFLLTIEAHDVGQERDLPVSPVTVGAVDLAVDVPGVDEEDFVSPGRLLLAPLSRNQSVHGSVTV